MSEYLTREEHTDALARVANDIDDVRADIAHLAETLASVLDVVEQSPTETTGEPSSGQWCWRTLTGQDRAALWGEVRAWVEWFNDRYGSAGGKVAIPACWPMHPVAVEELTGLMVAWRCAHDVAKPSDSLIAWHDRWLWPCLERLYGKQGCFTNCTLGKHDLRHGARVPAVSDDVFDNIVRDDLAASTPAGTDAAPTSQEAP